MDSDPLPVLEKSDALQRHQLHGSPQETGFYFRHPPPGAKRMKSMDGKAQRTTVMASLCEAEPAVPRRPKSEMRLDPTWTASKARPGAESPPQSTTANGFRGA